MNHSSPPLFNIVPWLRVVNSLVKWDPPARIATPRHPRFYASYNHTGQAPIPWRISEVAALERIQIRSLEAFIHSILKPVAMTRPSSLVQPGRLQIIKSLLTHSDLYTLSIPENQRVRLLLLADTPRTLIIMAILGTCARWLLRSFFMTLSISGIRLVL